MYSITIGTRGSNLALRQTHWVAKQLSSIGIETSIEVIKTTGDKITDVGLAKVGSESGTKGIFTKEIEQALLDGRIDIAVHSLKDMPTKIDAGLSIAAIPKRADARDAVVGRRIEELHRGDRIGTSSLRRAAQMRHLRPDIAILDIRGNVDTRLKKLDEGHYDSILLASAGLHRLSLGDRIAEILDCDVMVPAVGQGALAIEARSDDDKVLKLLDPLHDTKTATEVAAERALLDALGGGCQVPLGAHATLEGDILTLSAVAVSPDGKLAVKTQQTSKSDQADKLGQKTAGRLLAEGATEIINFL